MQEEWKWIKGFEGRYQISNHGRLKSFCKNKNGQVRSNKNKNGDYLAVRLRDNNGNYRSVRLHVLVAESFIGDIPQGYDVHHKDGNKQNNHVDNLEILSRSEHVRETIKQNPNVLRGLFNTYERIGKPVAQYDLNGNWICTYKSGSSASKQTGVCARNIMQVANHTPYNEKGSVRKQAGGYIWEFAIKGVVFE